MRRVTSVKIFFLGAFLIYAHNACSQDFIADTTAETSSLQNAVNLYHQFLSPETGLYNGREYSYNAYYPFIINEGHPFLNSTLFDSGTVFYNNVLYENVPLLYDIVNGELLINDPSHIYIIRLNNERISWFTIAGHTFIKLKQDISNDGILHPGFYDILYDGHIVLYKKVTKTFNENTSSLGGINKYVIESYEYFIKKDNQFYKIKNKKSLLLPMSDQKNKVADFMKKNKLKFKKTDGDALTKIVAYYDGINNKNPKALN